MYEEAIARLEAIKGSLDTEADVTYCVSRFYSRGFSRGWMWQVELSLRNAVCISVEYDLKDAVDGALAQITLMKT